jgi:hypothetical protein
LCGRDYNCDAIKVVIVGGFLGESIMKKKNYIGFVAATCLLIGSVFNLFNQFYDFPVSVRALITVFLLVSAVLYGITIAQFAKESKQKKEHIDNMIHIAKSALFSLEDAGNELPQSQITVLLTEQNNTYIAKNDTQGLVCKELIEKNDTKVILAVTMWKNEEVDFPSWVFRKALVEMNEENNGTDILLQGKSDFVTKKLSATMK